MDSASRGPSGEGSELRVWNDLIPHLSIDRRIKLTGGPLKLLSYLEGRVHSPLPRVQTSRLENVAEQEHQLWFWETAESMAEQPARVKGNKKKELHLVLLQNRTKGILMGLLGEQTYPVFWQENGTKKTRAAGVCVCVCVCMRARSVVSDTFALWEFIINKKPDFTIGWGWTQKQNEDKIVLNV